MVKYVHQIHGNWQHWLENVKQKLCFDKCLSRYLYSIYYFYHGHMRQKVKKLFMQLDQFFKQQCLVSSFCILCFWHYDDVKIYKTTNSRTFILRLFSTYFSLKAASSGFLCFWRCLPKSGNWEYQYDTQY